MMSLVASSVGILSELYRNCGRGLSREEAFIGKNMIVLRKCMHIAAICLLLPVKPHYA